jgi:hypothetical protein
MGDTGKFRLSPCSREDTIEEENDGNDVILKITSIIT